MSATSGPEAAVRHAAGVGRPPSVGTLAQASPTTVAAPDCSILLVEVAREAIAAGQPESARGAAAELARVLLQPVVSATGVLLHEPRPSPVGRRAGGGATNLELDLLSGRRSAPPPLRTCWLAWPTPAALVVNNNAAAVLLVLASLAQGRGAGQQGRERRDRRRLQGARGDGAVRRPPRRRRDHEPHPAGRLRAGPAPPRADVALVLKVHPSNYRVEGFVEDTTTAALAALPGGCPSSPTSARPAGRRLPVAGDRSAAVAEGRAGRPPDPRLRAALVTFSGDKLLGGPQAGIIAGRSELVEACAAHPLAQALRPGGLMLSALQDVLLACCGVMPDAPCRSGGWRRSRSSSSKATPRRRHRRGCVVAAPVGRRRDGVAAGAPAPTPGTVVPSAGLVVNGDRSAEPDWPPRP